MEDRKCTGCYTDAINNLFKPQKVLAGAVVLCGVVFTVTMAYFNILQNDKDAKKERQEIKGEIKKLAKIIEKSGEITGLCMEESKLDSNSLIIAEISKEEQEKRKRIANHEISFDKKNYIEVE